MIEVNQVIKLTVTLIMSRDKRKLIILQVGT